MKLTALLTEDAAADLADIVDYVTAADGPLRAGRVLDQFEKTLLRLEDLPERDRTWYRYVSAETRSDDRRGDTGYVAHRTYSPPEMHACFHHAGSHRVFLRHKGPEAAGHSSGVSPEFQ